MKFGFDYVFFSQVTFDINMYTDRKQSKETKDAVSKSVFAPHPTILQALPVGYRHGSNSKTGHNKSNFGNENAAA